jgi:hypothetical protein
VEATRVRNDGDRQTEGQEEPTAMPPLTPAQTAEPATP